MEYWQPLEPFELPKNVYGMWNYKSETDLYEFKKVRSAICYVSHLILTGHSQNPLQPVSHYLPIPHNS